MKSNHLPKQRWLTPILPSIQGIGTVLENRTVIRSPGIRSHYRLDESWCDLSRFILAMDLPQNLRELVNSGDSNAARRLSPFFLGSTKLMTSSFQTHLSIHLFLTYRCCRGNFSTQKLILKRRGPGMLRVRVSLHIEHRRHNNGYCQRGLLHSQAEKRARERQH